MINKRRRILKVIALSGGMAFMPEKMLAATGGLKSIKWEGKALGAWSSIELFSDDRDHAKSVLNKVEALIQKYEKIFSIYDETSELSDLNKSGYLEKPSEEFLKLTKLAKGINQKTGGAFDVTIQPLWDLYSKEINSDHLLTKVEAVMPLIGSDKLRIEKDRISLSNPGMAISFNGIAQGYITDKVSDYLKSEGFENVLVDLGEYRSGGPQADGEPWRIGILNPFDGISVVDVIEMKTGAIATSSGYGNAFDILNDQHHHLFNPRTGMSSNLYASVSVVAKNAAVADALSTAFTNMTVEQIKAHKNENGVDAVYLINHDGKVTHL